MRQILLFAALAAVLALLLVSCGGTKDKPVPTEEDAPGKAAYHKISAEEAYEMMISQEIAALSGSVSGISLPMLSLGTRTAFSICPPSYSSRVRTSTTTISCEIIIS